MSDELVTWLRAAIDEDEAIALATRTCSCGRCEMPLAWTIDDDGIDPLGVGLRHTVAPGYLNPEQGAHIARHDPARVLREVEAKRRIIEFHERSDCRGHDAAWIPHGEACTYECVECSHDFPCATLRLLALPYADREGYREEWAV